MATNKLRMRNTILIFLLIGFGVQVWGQKTINEAHITYEITDVQSSDPEAEAHLQMMKGSTIDVYFKEDRQRMDLDMMGGMMKMSTFINTEAEGSNALYMDMMGRKIKVNMTDVELEQYQNKAEEAASKPVITPDYSDTKEISGFKCHKVTITYEGQADMGLTAYVTKELKSPESVIQNAGDVDFGGVPMEYTVASPDFSLTYSTVKFEDSLSSSAFDSPGSDYEEMNFDQFIQTMGALGGAMGQ